MNLNLKKTICYNVISCCSYIILNILTLYLFLKNNVSESTDELICIVLLLLFIIITLLINIKSKNGKLISRIAISIVTVVAGYVLTYLITLCI